MRRVALCSMSLMLGLWGFAGQSTTARSLPPARTSQVAPTGRAPAPTDAGPIVVPPDEEQGGELEIEKEDQPYMPGPRGLDGNAVAGASAFVQVGPFRSVQVNVNAQGQNIFGDAANEPSLAISPTN